MLYPHKINTYICFFESHTIVEIEFHILFIENMCYILIYPLGPDERNNFLEKNQEGKMKRQTMKTILSTKKPVVQSPDLVN